MQFLPRHRSAAAILRHQVFAVVDDSGSFFIKGSLWARQVIHPLYQLVRFADHFTNR